MSSSLLRYTVFAVVALSAAHSSAADRAAEIDAAFLSAHQLTATAHYAATERAQYVYPVLTTRLLRERFPGQGQSETVRAAAEIIVRSFEESRRARPSREFVDVRFDATHRVHSRVQNDPRFSDATIPPRAVVRALVESFLSVDRAAIDAPKSNPYAIPYPAAHDPAGKVFTVNFVRELSRAAARDQVVAKTLEEQSEVWRKFRPAGYRTNQDLLESNPEYARGDVAKVLEAVRARLHAGPVSDADAFQVAQLALSEMDGSSELSATIQQAASPTAEALTKRPLTSEQIQNLQIAEATLLQVGDLLHGDLGEAATKIAHAFGFVVAVVRVAYDDYSAIPSLFFHLNALFGGGRDPLAQVLEEMHGRFDDVVTRLVVLELKLDLYVGDLIQAAELILDGQADIQREILLLRDYVETMRYELAARLEKTFGAWDDARDRTLRAEFQEKVLEFVIEDHFPAPWERRTALSLLYTHAVSYACEDRVIGQPIERLTIDDVRKLPLPLRGSSAQHDQSAPATPDGFSKGWRRRSPNEELLWFDTLRLSSWPADGSFDRFVEILKRAIDDKATPAQDRCPDIDAFCLAVERWAEFYNQFPDDALEAEGQVLLSKDKIDNMRRAADHMYLLLNMTRSPAVWDKLLTRYATAHGECIASMEELTRRFHAGKMQLSPQDYALAWPFSPERLDEHFRSPPNLYEMFKYSASFAASFERASGTSSDAIRKSSPDDFPYLHDIEALYPHSLVKLNPKNRIAIDEDRTVALPFTDNFVETVTSKPSDNIDRLLPENASKGIPHWLRALAYLKRENYNEELNLTWSGTAFFNPGAPTVRGHHLPAFTSSEITYSFSDNPRLRVTLTLNGEQVIGEARWSIPALKKTIFEYHLRLNYDLERLQGPKKYNQRIRNFVIKQAGERLNSPLDSLGLVEWNDHVLAGSAEIELLDARAANSDARKSLIYDECMRIERDLLELLAAACDIDGLTDEQFKNRLNKSPLKLEVIENGEKHNLAADFLTLREKARELSTIAMLIAYGQAYFVPEFDPAAPKSTAATWLRRVYDDRPRRGDEDFSLNVYPRGSDLSRALRLVAEASPLLLQEPDIQNITYNDSRTVLAIAILRSWLSGFPVDIEAVSDGCLKELTAAVERRANVARQVAAEKTQFDGWLKRLELAAANLQRTDDALADALREDSSVRDQIAAEYAAATKEYKAAKAGFDSSSEKLVAAYQSLDKENAKLPLFDRVVETQRRLERLEQSRVRSEKERERYAESLQQEHP